MYLSIRDKTNPNLILNSLYWNKLCITLNNIYFGVLITFILYQSLQANPAIRYK